jgi:hypothetical protein
MTDERWQRRPDVAWAGDHERVVAARTSPPDADGPRILEGAAAWVWLALSRADTAPDLARLAQADGAPEGALADIAMALTHLRSAGLAQSE